MPTRPATADTYDVAELSSHGALIVLWDQFEHGMNYQAYPDWFQDWPERETAATTLRGSESLVVPGLLTDLFPTLWVILDESVQHRPVGGRQVVLEQVSRLAEAAQRPNIAIEVIPAGERGRSAS